MYLVAPFGFSAGTSRDPRVDANRRRITAGLLSVTMERGDSRSRFLTGRIGKWHPTVAPFGTAAQGCVGVTPIPQRDLAPNRERVDSGILDPVPLCLQPECGSAANA